MILSHPTDTTVSMDCYCEACLDVISTPPPDYIDPKEVAYDMAQEACWQDGQD